MLLFFSLKTEKKMNSETPPTISMALVNPQMPSVSADGKNSSTQQLSISVWVTRKPLLMSNAPLETAETFSREGVHHEGARQGLSPLRVYSGVPSCTPTIHDGRRSWSWRRERWWECTANSRKGGCAGCRSGRDASASCPATTSHLCWGEMPRFHWWWWRGGANWPQVRILRSLSRRRTSARLLETKAANTSSQHNPALGKKPAATAAAKNPSVFLALDKVNSDAAVYSAGTVPPVPDGAQNAMSSMSAGKPSLYGSTQGWDTVRRIFNPHRGEN